MRFAGKHLWLRSKWEFDADETRFEDGAFAVTPISLLRGRKSILTRNSFRPAGRDLAAGLGAIVLIRESQLGASLKAQGIGLHALESKAFD
jgi:hypothetical protein